MSTKIRDRRAAVVCCTSSHQLRVLVCSPQMPSRASRYGHWKVIDMVANSIPYAAQGWDGMECMKGPLEWFVADLEMEGTGMPMLSSWETLKRLEASARTLHPNLAKLLWVPRFLWGKLT